MTYIIIIIIIIIIFLLHLLANHMPIFREVKYEECIH